MKGLTEACSGGSVLKLRAIRKVERCDADLAGLIGQRAHDFDDTCRHPDSATAPPGCQDWIRAGKQRVAGIASNLRNDWGHAPVELAGPGIFRPSEALSDSVATKRHGLLPHLFQCCGIFGPR